MTKKAENSSCSDLADFVLGLLSILQNIVDLSFIDDSTHLNL